MKHAYHTHRQAMLRIEKATSLEVKKLLALSYFELEAPFVDEEMEKKLKEDERE